MTYNDIDYVTEYFELRYHKQVRTLGRKLTAWMAGSRGEFGSNRNLHMFSSSMSALDILETVLKRWNVS